MKLFYNIVCYYFNFGLFCFVSEVHILTQRSLKIEYETEKHNKGKKDVEHQLHELEISLHKMTVGLHNKRGYKELLDKENLIIQTEALGLLKVLALDVITYTIRFDFQLSNN